MWCIKFYKLQVRNIEFLYLFIGTTFDNCRSCWFREGNTLRIVIVTIEFLVTIAT